MKATINTEQDLVNEEYMGHVCIHVATVNKIKQNTHNHAAQNNLLFTRSVTEPAPQYSITSCGEREFKTYTK